MSTTFSWTFYMQITFSNNEKILKRGYYRESLRELLIIACVEIRLPQIFVCWSYLRLKSVHRDVVGVLDTSESRLSIRSFIGHAVKSVLPS